METIAVYWEPRIKTYGFQENSDLSLFETNCRFDELPTWGQKFQNMGDLGINFHLALIQLSGDREIQLSLLVRCRDEHVMKSHLNRLTAMDKGKPFHMTSPVELIFFHGPHFGDRYGIVESAFRSLADRNIRVLAAGCSTSSIYIVLPEGKAQDARAVLTETFKVPQ